MNDSPHIKALALAISTILSVATLVVTGLAAWDHRTRLPYLEHCTVAPVAGTLGRSDVAVYTLYLTNTGEAEAKNINWTIALPGGRFDRGVWMNPPEAGPRPKGSRGRANIFTTILNPGMTISAKYTAPWPPPKEVPSHLIQGDGVVSVEKRCP